jgi:cytochrome c553
MCGLVLAASYSAWVAIEAQAPAAAVAPTFSRDVAPIMFANCASCHRPGEVAPMPLLSF